MTLENIERIYMQEMARFEYQLENGIINKRIYDQEVRDLNEWASEAEKEILS